jgi:hypothetical protein
MYLYIHSFLRSQRASPVAKNPASQTRQDVRNIQIVKEQKSSKEKLSFRLKTCRNQQQVTVKSGGARRDRTADLLRARQALSQLSYGPSENGGSGKI